MPLANRPCLHLAIFVFPGKLDSFHMAFWMSHSQELYTLPVWTDDIQR